jgi:dinuclear metal center YbgI/SA1388 family protein
VSASLADIVSLIDRELDIDSFKDESRNGLQVEGSETVNRVGLAVDACLGSFKAAVEAKCDLLVVHHGLIWSKGLGPLRGADYTRIAMLIENRLALYGCHLPLDAHPRLGNNAQLASLLGLDDVKSFASYKGSDIGVSCSLTVPLTARALADSLSEAIGHAAGITCSAGVVGDPNRSLQTLGIVSGGGTLAITESVAAGFDALITGEGPHHANLDAIDNGLTLVYAGHYETETLGVLALGKFIQESFDVETRFLDVEH